MAVRRLVDGGIEHVGDRGEQVDIGRQGRTLARCDARPMDQQRRVTDRLELRHAGLTPDICAIADLAQIVTVIRAHDECGIRPQVVGIERIENAPEPVIDHRQLGAVVRPQVAGLAFGQGAGFERTGDVGRPHDPVFVPRLVEVATGPWLRRVKRLVRIELVDEQEPSVVVRRGIDQEPGGVDHGAWARPVGFFSEERAGSVVAAFEPVQTEVLLVEPTASAGG